MEIEVINDRRVSHLNAEKIRIRHGTNIFTIELSTGQVIVSTADSEDSQKTLIIQPVHTNKVKIL